MKKIFMLFAVSGMFAFTLTSCGAKESGEEQKTEEHADDHDHEHGKGHDHSHDDGHGH